MFSSVKRWLWGTVARRTILIVALIVLLAGLTVRFFALPRIEAWAAKQFPEATAIQKQLEGQLPDKKVSVGDQTFYSTGTGGNDTKRLLSITIVGKEYVTKSEVNAVRPELCNQLKSKHGIYDRIVLQSSVEQRYLGVFFTRQSVTGLLGCDPRYFEESTQNETNPITLSTPQPLPEGKTSTLDPGQLGDIAPPQQPTTGTCCEIQEGGDIVTNLD